MKPVPLNKMQEAKPLLDAYHGEWYHV